MPVHICNLPFSKSITACNNERNPTSLNAGTSCADTVDESIQHRKAPNEVPRQTPPCYGNHRKRDVRRRMQARRRRCRHAGCRVRVHLPEWLCGLRQDPTTRGKIRTANPDRLPHDANHAACRRDWGKRDPRDCGSHTRIPRCVLVSVGPTKRVCLGGTFCGGIFLSFKRRRHCRRCGGHRRR